MVSFRFIDHPTNIREILPEDAEFLAIHAGPPWSDLPQYCPLGVIKPEDSSEGRRTVAYVALQDGPAVQAFLLVARRRPGNVWIVATSFTLDVIIAILILLDRAANEWPREFGPQGLGEATPMPSDRPRHQRMRELALLVDEARRYEKGWITRWPGPQYGSDVHRPWADHGKASEVLRLVGANQLISWTREQDERLDQGVGFLALKAWFEGQVGFTQTSKDPKREAFAAAQAGDLQTLLAAAARAGIDSRLEILQDHVEENVRVATFGGKQQIAWADVAQATIPPIAVAQAGFKLAPVVAVLAPSPERTFARFDVWIFHESYFDLARFLAEVRAKEGYDWSVVPANEHRGMHVISSEAQPSALTPDEFLDLVVSCSRR